MDDLIFNFLDLVDLVKWAVLFIITVLATFFIYTAIMYRMFLSSREDMNLLDLPGYPFFSYMILKREIKPATIFNRMPKEKIEESLKSFQNQFSNVAVHCEEKKNAATAFVEFREDHIYKELYIYWDRKSLETHYEAELKKNTKVRLEIINKKRLLNYEAMASTRFVASGDIAFDGKYTILTNRPAVVQQLGNEFLKTAVNEDLESLLVEGKHVNIKTPHREDIKQVITLLLEFEKNAGKML